MPRTLYQKFRDLWKDKPDKTTPVTAKALMHFEQGIYDNSANMALKEIYGDNAILMGRTSSKEVGTNSATFGSNNKASGYNAFSSGFYNEASGEHATAFGNSTISSAYGSFSEGLHTKASSSYQHVQGRYNIEDVQNRYAHIVGGGTSNSDRKNIYALDWGGNAWFAGNVTNGNGVSLSGLKSEVDEVRNIASGASTAKVFNTKEELDEWLETEGNPETLKVGQNIYIKAKDTPDYWWDGTGLQELETGTVTIEELTYDETIAILNGSGVA